MPRLSIECSEDKLITLIPILLKEGVKCMVSPDKEVVLIKNLIENNKNVIMNNIQYDSFAKNTLEVIASGESVPRNVKHVHHVKGRKLTDIVYEYFLETPNATLSSLDIGKRITLLGFKQGSASSTLADLYSLGKLVRIKNSKTFYYSLSKSDASNL